MIQALGDSVLPAVDGIARPLDGACHPGLTLLFAIIFCLFGWLVGGWFPSRGQVQETQSYPWLLPKDLPQIL